MKKFLLMMAVALTTTGAYAESCTTKLEDQYGLDIETHYGWGYSRRAACDDSMNKCMDDLRDRKQRARRWDDTYELRRLRNSNCVTEYDYEPDYPSYPDYPSSTVCTYELRRNYGNGRLIDAYTVSGRNACSRAYRQCSDELSRRQRRGRNPNASCVSQSSRPTYPTPTPRPRPNPRPRIKTCVVERISAGGRHIENHSGSAYDMETACLSAHKICRASKRSSQRCHRRY